MVFGSTDGQGFHRVTLLLSSSVLTELSCVKSHHSPVQGFKCSREEGRHINGQWDWVDVIYDSFKMEISFSIRDGTNLCKTV